MVPGLHCSVLRGFDAAMGEAEALAAPAMQMLPYRRHREPSDEEFEAFRERLGASDRRLLVHSRFVPSLASSSRERRERSAALLSRELRLSARWGAEAFVLHAGAFSPDGDLASGLKLAAETVRRARGEAGHVPPILIENVPGGGRRMGGTLEELSRLLEGLGDGAGVCLDTAHAWAAGYDLSKAEGMLRFLSRVHRLLGAERVGAFHLNDTRALLGSHRESHVHWGEGFLGSDGLSALLARPEYEGTPAILETPKDEGGDARNWRYLEGLRPRQ